MNLTTQHQNQQISKVGQLVLVRPGTYLTEFKKGYELPAFFTIKNETHGLVIEDLDDRKLILINDGDANNKIFASNNEFQGI